MSEIERAAAAFAEALANLQAARERLQALTVTPDLFKLGSPGCGQHYWDSFEELLDGESCIDSDMTYEIECAWRLPSMWAVRESTGGRGYGEWRLAPSKEEAKWLRVWKEREGLAP